MNFRLRYVKRYDDNYFVVNIKFALRSSASSIMREMYIREELFRARRVLILVVQEKLKGQPEWGGRVSFSLRSGRSEIRSYSLFFVATISPLRFSSISYYSQAQSRSRSEETRIARNSLGDAL